MTTVALIMLFAVTVIIGLVLGVGIGIHWVKHPILEPGSRVRFRDYRPGFRTLIVQDVTLDHGQITVTMNGER